MQAGQDDAEPRGVFDGKAAGQPVATGVVKVENALKAGHVAAALMKAMDDFGYLVRLGGVFGVVNADDAATALAEPEIQGARFGLDAALWDRDDAHG